MEDAVVSAFKQIEREITAFGSPRPGARKQQQQQLLAALTAQQYEEAVRAKPPHERSVELKSPEWKGHARTCRQAAPVPPGQLSCTAMSDEAPCQGQAQASGVVSISFHSFGSRMSQVPVAKTGLASATAGATPTRVQLLGSLD